MLGNNDLRIRHVETFLVDAHDRTWVFVKVQTEEPGLYGWGEASLTAPRAVAGAVADLAELIVGQDASRTAHLWQTMFRQLFYKGGVVTMSAISGIEQALWDIKAKALGVPLYEMLGGRVRDRVRAYDHLIRWMLGLDWNLPEAWAEAARRSVNDGFDAIKIYPVPPGRPLEGRAAVDEAVRFTSAVRGAVGDEVDLLIDMHGRTSPHMAILYADALAPFRPMFLEEPCQPEFAAATRTVSRASHIPIATGERLTNRWEFRTILEQLGCAVVQPDACNCGGISEFLRIAADAETHFVSVAPHNPSGPVATATTVHLSLVIPNLLIMEQLREDVPWRNELVDTPLVPKDGHFDLPSGPGIGVDVIEEVARAHPFQPRAPYRSYAPDGAVIDD